MQSQVVRSFLGRTERGPLGLFGLDAPSGGDRRSLKRDLDDGRRILLRRPGVAEIRAIDKKSREVEIVASTSGVKRDGNAIYHSDAAWDFTNFAKVPAMLWSHDYGSAFAPPGLPTGFWRSWGIEKYKGSKALCMRGYLEDDEFPEKIWRRIQSGSIRAVSIGWNPLKFEELLDDTGQQAGWVFTLNELYECSWVVIGADPDAGVRNSLQAYEGLTEQELDAFNGRRVHEFSRGVAYVLDHREAPTELVRSLRTKSGVALMDMEALSMDESPSVVQAEAVPVEPAVYPVAPREPETPEQPELAPATPVVPEPAEEPVPTAPDPGQATAALVPEIRIGKKMAGQRLKELKGYRASLISVTEGISALIAQLEGQAEEPAAESETAAATAPLDLSALRLLADALADEVSPQKQYVAELFGDLLSKADELRAIVAPSSAASDA